MVDLNKIIEELSTVVEAHNFLSSLRKMGSNSIAPVAAAFAGAAAAPAGEEKSEFSLFLAAAGAKKLMLLKK